MKKKELKRLKVINQKLKVDKKEGNHVDAVLEITSNRKELVISPIINSQDVLATYEAYNLESDDE